MWTNKESQKEHSMSFYSMILASQQPNIKGRWTEWDIHLGPTRLPMARLVWPQTHRQVKACTGMSVHSLCIRINSLRVWCFHICMPSEKPISHPLFLSKISTSIHWPSFSTAMPYSHRRRGQDGSGGLRRPVVWLMLALPTSWLSGSAVILSCPVAS